MSSKSPEHYGKDIQIPDKASSIISTNTSGISTNARLRKDDEINPDVLGYIFEKYINQRRTISQTL